MNSPATEAESGYFRVHGRFGVWPTVIGVLLVVVFGLAMPMPFVGRAGVAAGDLFHAPLFGGLALLAMYLLEQLRPTTGRPLLLRGILVGIGLVLFGISMEAMQYFVGRTATVHDAVANSLGILAALIWYSSRRYHGTVARFMMLAALVTLTVAWYPPFTIFKDVWAVHRDFPLLASFESSPEIDRWYFRECSGVRVAENATDGDYALEIQYQATPYPGATLVELHQDWSQIRSLEIDVIVKSAEAVTFEMKVIDATINDTQDYEDLFKRQWMLESGKHHLSVTRQEIVDGPPDRKTELSRIRYVDLIVVDPDQPVTLRIDNMHLVLRTTP